MDNTSFSSVFELDQNQIHNFEAGAKGGTDVDYSHASKCEQNDEHNKPQPHVDYPYASNGEKPQHDQSQPHPDQQLPPQPPEAPQRPPGQPVQYPPQGNRPMYEARPAGHVHFAPQSPQINFVFENGPKPTQFPPQSPQSQPVPIHNVQMAQPAQFSQVHYHQANPVYTNGPHQPAAAYPQGTQARSIHPPGPAQSMGPPPGASPRHPAGYQSAPSPVKFPPENGGVLGGFGHDTPDNSGSAGYANRPASGFPVQHPGRVPVMVLQQQVPTEGWKTGLFDCMDDPNNALVTAFCPCITFGQIAEIVDNGNTPCTTSGLLYGLIVFLIAMPCVMSCTYRTKLRSRFGLVESPAPDWVTHFLCECCAICQEYRELQHRGLDPSIGWQGNVARIQAGLHQQQQVNMMPPVNQRMMA